MTEFYDYRLAQHTVSTLRTAASIDKPFYVMTGFRRPHRDFRSHARFWAMYDPDGSASDSHFPPIADIPTAKYSSRDPSQPEYAFHAAGCTLPNGTTVPGNADNPLPIEVQKWMRLGYYAALTQTDELVGTVLDELDNLGVANNTIVVLHSDHGA